MYPRLLTVPFTIHTYGVLLALAFLAGLLIVSWQARKAGMDAGRLTDMAVWVLIAGLLGAKLMLLVVEWDHYFRNPRDLLSLLRSGGVFYGGLLGGIAVAWYYVRRYKLPGWRTADVLAPGLILGQAIGRLGCLASGCCYGRPTSVPWALTFADIYAAREFGTPVDTPLHPSQVYESLANFLIFLLLIWLAPRKRFHGQVILTYVVLYSGARFVLEFFRGDPARWTFSKVLSDAQIVGIILLLAVALVLPKLLKSQRT